jgi:hypothetical protein
MTRPTAKTLSILLASRHCVCLDFSNYCYSQADRTEGPNHYFYTPCSGIWQSVWIEAAGASNYVTRLDLSGDMNGQVTINVRTLNSASDNVQMSIRERGQMQTTLASKSFKANGETIFSTGQTPRRWSPDSPILYDVEIQVGEERISSYLAFRTFENRNVNGVHRPMLNGQFIVSRSSF